MDASRAARILALTAGSLSACRDLRCGTPAPTVSSAAPSQSVAPPLPPVESDPLGRVMAMVASGELTAAKEAFPGAIGASPVELVAARAPIGAPGLGATYSANGGRVGVLLGDNELRVFDLTSWRKLATLGPVDPSATFNADGTLLLSGADLWDVDGRKKILAVGAAAVFSPDGMELAFVKRPAEPGTPGEVVIWSASARRVTATLTWEAAPGATSVGVDSLEFLTDGGRLSARCEDDKTREWDTATGVLLSVRAGGRLLRGDKAAIGAYAPWTKAAPAAPERRELRSGVHLGPMTAPGCETATSGTLDPRGERLFTVGPGAPGAAPPTSYDRVCVWDLHRGGLVSKLDLPPDVLSVSALSDLGRVVHVTGDGSAAVIQGPHVALVYDLPTGRKLDELPDAFHVGTAHDGALLLLDEPHATLIRVLGSDRVSRVPCAATRRGVVLPDASMGTRTLPAVGGQGLRMLDGLSGQLLELRAEDGPWVTTASPDGRWLVGADATGGIRAWDLAARAPVFASPVAPPLKHSLEGVGFSRKGDAFTVFSEKGDEYRFDLPGASFHAAMVPSSAASGGVASGPRSDPSDDVPDVVGAALSPDARAMVLRDRSPELRIETPSLGASIKLTLRKTPVIWPGMGCDCDYDNLVVSPDGAVAGAIFGLSNDIVLRLFRLKTRSELPYIAAAAAAFSFDHAGRRVALQAQQRADVVLYQLEPRRKLAEVEISKDDSEQPSIAWSPDDKVVAVGNTKLLALVDVKAKSVRCTGAFSGPVAFSRSGEWVAAYRGGPVVVRASDCSLVHEMAPAPSPAPASERFQPAFSPDAALLATLEPGGGVEIFDASSGGSLLSIRFVGGSAAAFSAEGHVELFGDASSAARLAGCVVRGHSVPLELCSERVSRAGLVASVLRPATAGAPDGGAR
jgi:WD40 repeat protein